MYKYLKIYILKDWRFLEDLQRSKYITPVIMCCRQIYVNIYKVITGYIFGSSKIFNLLIFFKSSNYKYH